MSHPTAAKRPLFFTIITRSYSVAAGTSLAIAGVVLGLRLSEWVFALPIVLGVAWALLWFVSGGYSRATRPKPWQTPYQWGLENALIKFGMNPFSWVWLSLAGVCFYFAFDALWWLPVGAATLLLAWIMIIGHALNVVDMLEDPRVNDGQIRYLRNLFAEYDKPILPRTE
jgi:hypothetical protein